MLIGIDVGGTKISGGLADDDGALKSQIRRSTDRAGRASAGYEAICEIIEELEGEAGRQASAVSRIGIGFGGPVDFEAGVVLLSHHVEGWEGFPLRSNLEERFGVPVVIDNDANAGTLGEWMFGAGRGCRDLFYINIGTGIGGGIISGGRMARGAHNLAGEIGHTVVVRSGPRCTCGNFGCLESCASGEAIGRRGTESLGRPVSSKELFALAATGDLTARKVLQEVIEDLAHGIGIIVSLLNPELVIVGGGLSEAPEKYFLEPLRHAYSRYCLNEAGRGLRIEPAQLGYDAGIAGAVALAMS